VAAVKERVAAELEAGRQRTLALVDPLDEADQVAQHSPLMSPLVWDLAHVANYEELWLARAVGGDPPIDPSLDELYDAFRNPRADRPRLPLLGPAEARAYAARVRARALAALEAADLDDRSSRLTADGFVFGMVLQHEHQHDETMLATRQLMGERATPPGGTTPGPTAEAAPSVAEVLVDGGTATLGTSTEPWAYDNERPAHPAAVAPFWIDTAPVTCGRHLEFVLDGGYDEPRWWSPAGWAWRQEAGLTAPEFWRPEGDGAWSVLRFGSRVDLRPSEPVQHVGWYEADAFARWAGRRLPSEEEWEVAAGPEVGPANLGARHHGPAEVGAYPAGASPWGCHQMFGDVWEWTASDFRPHPGFEAFPYREYSEVFFGPEHKVLRGGSWATHPLAVRPTFRNWDLPIRRQIFAGFRCARDP
jgi:iron(II)-dependent oxidoreductase